VAVRISVCISIRVINRISIRMGTIAVIPGPRGWDLGVAGFDEIASVLIVN
jgi:hypothetical protein